MFKYVAMIVGILIMCVPEDTGLLRLVLQAGVGLSIFGLGALLALNEQTS